MWNGTNNPAFNHLIRDTRTHTTASIQLFSFLPFHFVLLISLECSEPLENSTLLNNGRRNYCTVSEAYETQTSGSRHPPHPKAAAKRDHKNVSLILVNNSTRNILKKDASACMRAGHTAANMLELTLSKSDTRAYSIQVSNMRLTPPPYGFQVMSPFISSLRLSHGHTLIHLSPDTPTPPTIIHILSAL